MPKSSTLVSTLVGHAFEVAQDERRAESTWQPGQFLLNNARYLVAIEIILPRERIHSP